MVWKKLFENLQLVFESKNHALLAAASALAFGILLYYLTLANVAFNSISIFIEMNGLAFTYFSTASIVAISTLFGINTALLAFKARRMQFSSKKKGVVGVFGSIAGLFASGCPTCGSILFAALAGNPLALFYLPYWGLELKALSILMLAVSIFLLALSIDKKSCKECK